MDVEVQHVIITPKRFRLLLKKCGPFDSMFHNLLDLLDEKNTFQPWFFPVPLTRADLHALGEKMNDIETPFMSFLVHPLPIENSYDDHAFRLVRYARSSTKFADDVIFHSIFGFHVSMTGSELRKVCRHEARIAKAVAEVTGFPESVLDILIDLITVAPPVFDRVSSLIEFYRKQNKLSMPVPFLQKFIYKSKDNQKKS